MSLHAYIVVKKIITNPNTTDGFSFVPLLESITQSAPKAVRFAHFIGSDCAVVNCRITYDQPQDFPNSVLGDIGTDNDTGNVPIEKDIHKPGWHMNKDGSIWYGSKNQKAAR